MWTRRFKCRHKSGRRAIKTRYIRPPAATNTIKSRFEGRTDGEQWRVCEWRAYASTCFGRCRVNNTHELPTRLRTSHTQLDWYTLCLCGAQYVTIRQTAAKVCSQKCTQTSSNRLLTKHVSLWYMCVRVRLSINHCLYFYCRHTLQHARKYTARTVEAHIGAVDQTTALASATHWNSTVSARICAGR